MFLRTASEDRPYHFGPFSEEVLLPRNVRERHPEAARPGSTVPVPHRSSCEPFGSSVRRYQELFADLVDGKVADKRAPVPDDVERRAVDIKGGGYFLNASQSAALDPKTGEFVMELTRRIVAEMKLTSVMVTHSMAQALQYDDRTIMFHRGEIVFDIAGEERTAMDVADLRHLFKRDRGEDISDDALLLD